MVFALPAASAPPTSLTTSNPADGTPRPASNMVGTVVTSKSSMILGLVNANSERATARTERRPARSGSTFVVAGVTTCPPCLHAFRTRQRPACRRLAGSLHPAAGTDDERHCEDAERHERDHPQDRPAHLLISDGAEDMMTETGLIFWAARCHRQQSGHSMTKLSSSEEFHG